MSIPMPRTNEQIDYFIKDSGKQGVWSLPFTILLFFVIALVWGLGQIIGSFVGMYNVFGEEFMPLLQSGKLNIEEYATHGEVIGPAASIGAVIGSLCIIFLIKIKNGLSVKDYLGLNVPKIKDFFIWAGIMILFMFGVEQAGNYIPELDTDFMTNIVQTVKNPWMLILSVGIIAPIFEELLFRGFLYKGIEQSKLGPHGAVWIGAIIFAVIHMQYSPAIILMIIPMALVLGYARMYSHTIWIPIALHIINNTLSTVLELQDAGVIGSF